MLAAWSSFDTDKDGRLSRTEWFESQIRSIAGECGALPFEAWDADHDGFVSRDEAESVNDASYGCVALDDTHLRHPDSRVINWLLLSAIDVDSNRTLTKPEFFTRAPHVPPPHAVFERLDADGDGLLSLKEWSSASPLATNVAADFAARDTNQDVRLSQSEIDASVKPSQRRVARRLAAAFDDDGDDQLSFAEYRLTPLTNPVIDWFAPRVDADFDGNLSWAEFHSPDVVVGLDLARVVFDRFDLDHDKVLSSREFPAKYDPGQMAAGTAFLVLDADSDGQLTLDELMFWERPAEGELQGVMYWEGGRICLEETIHAADRNADGAISLEEFTESQQSIGDVLTDRRLAYMPVKRNLPAAPGKIASKQAESIAPWIGLNVIGLGVLAWLFRRHFFS